MLDIVYDFLDSPLWDMTAALALAGGIAALVGLLLPPRNGARRWTVWAGLGLLLASVIVSMVFEDLLPTLPTLPEHRRLPYALSFPGYLAATGLIVYGGWRFVRDTLAPPAGFGRQGRLRRGQPYMRTGRQSLAMLLRLWAPGLSWMAAGFALMVFSASLHHENHFPLGWLWALFKTPA